MVDLLGLFEAEETKWCPWEKDTDTSELHVLCVLHVCVCLVVAVCEFSC
jgi:hypothetical protein